MTPTTIPLAVTIDHWQAYRVTAGDTIERWSIEHAGRTLLTFETELEARRACREHNWIIIANTDTGWINRPTGDDDHADR